MYFQIEPVLEKYGLDSCQTTRGRQMLLCQKDHMLYALKEYAGTEHKAELLYQLGTYLAENGWMTDGLVKNREGTCVTEGVDGVAYTLHRYYRGRECDCRNQTEILLAVSGLARLHARCRLLSHKELPLPEGEDPLNVYVRHTKELKKIYQFVINRKKKNEFEQLYIKSFSEYYRQCEAVCCDMQKRQWDGAGQKTGICHGDFHYHNVLFFAGRPVFLQFLKAGYDWQIFDLCTFMRKILEKNGWDPMLGQAMVETYHRENPINEETFWQMYYRMAFPEKFWKLANRYYVSNKAWISPRNREKLQTEIYQNPKRLNYLDRMVFFCKNIC